MVYSNRHRRHLHSHLRSPSRVNPFWTLPGRDGAGGEAVDGVEKPKKKKTKKDPLLSKKAKSDPNAPPANRLPLPDL